MSIEIARYQFHSWARKGIASKITEKDDLGGGSSLQKERAEITLPVDVNGTGLTKNLTLIGPGDIIGINRDMIIRTEPLNWITDFEPNYLCFAEFYDEDFAWRYTPATADGEKLRPWIFLLLLKEDEFERTNRRIPLTSIIIKNKDAFPPSDETWLWAHVHSNANIPDEELSQYELFLRSINSIMNDDPDQLYCRLMSPRKMEANTNYFAFIVPAFEIGRLTGIEQPTENINAQISSWDMNGSKGEMPVYYEWQFRTGINADFESLVNALSPRAMDPSVGIRDMDCSSPGFVKADGTSPFPSTLPPVIGLEGALKAPGTLSTVFPDPASPNNFQIELEKLANLPVDIIGKSNSGDPVISVPLYGGNHAKTSPADKVKLNITNDSWVHDLNKDPRNRVAAGFGTLVVQKNQETYMREAWEQIQKIIEANRRIKISLLYMKVGLKFFQKTLNNLEPNVLLAMSKPLLRRVTSGQATIHQQLAESNLPAAVFSGTFKRLTSGKVATRLNVRKKFQYNFLITKLNTGKVAVATPKGNPAGAINMKDFSEKTAVDKFPQELTDSQMQMKSIANVPPRPQFTLKINDEVVAPPPAGSADSAEAVLYRRALKDFSKRILAKTQERIIKPFNTNAAFVKVKDAIHPHTSFPLRLSSLVIFPGNKKLDEPRNIFSAMAYPDIEDPMYKKLAEISEELLLPNLKLIPPNTISLLNTNSKFIESYLVGLNHEMGRELLWREYPTDQRGTYFRQFWDVNGIVKPAQNMAPAQRTEEQKDIKSIDTWASHSKLGSHNNRQTESGSEELVLAIRGNLFKKYPNCIIFMQKAVMDTVASEPEIKLNLTDAEFKDQVKFPLYKAEILPDIKFFGFDFTIAQALGKAPTPSFTDNLGWFFIIQQIPGEPRFGMDISGEDPHTWDDLAWNNFTTNVKIITKGAILKSNHIPPADQANWGVSSADMAYILFQKPAMVAVHAKQMLDKFSA
jgi:hypothetical protein